MPVSSVPDDTETPVIVSIGDLTDLEDASVLSFETPTLSDAQLQRVALMFAGYTLQLTSGLYYLKAPDGSPVYRADGTTPISASTMLGAWNDSEAPNPAVDDTDAMYWFDNYCPTFGVLTSLALITDAEGSRYRCLVGPVAFWATTKGKAISTAFALAYLHRIKDA